MTRGVRRGRADDVAAIAALWRELLAAHAERDPVFALRSGAEGALEAAVQRALTDDDAAVWVVEHEGRCVAFCAAHLERAPSLASETCRVEITEIAVAPAQRRSGIGRALTDAALTWARGREVARVEVRVATRNGEGQAFWRAQGFGDFVDVLDRRL